MLPFRVVRASSAALARSLSRASPTYECARYIAQEARWSSLAAALAPTSRRAFASLAPASEHEREEARSILAAAEDPETSVVKKQNLQQSPGNEDSSATAAASSRESTTDAEKLAEIDALFKDIEWHIGHPFPRYQVKQRMKRIAELAAAAAESGNVNARLRLIECKLWGVGMRSRPKRAFEDLQVLINEHQMPEAMCLAARMLDRRLNNELILPSHRSAAFGITPDHKVVSATIDPDGNPLDDPEALKTPRDLTKDMLKLRKKHNFANPLEILMEQQNAFERERKPTIRKHYETAAELGSLQALVDWGDFELKEGNGQLALNLYQRGADRHYAPAYQRLGTLYMEGAKDVERDIDLAIKKLSVAANMDDAIACFQLGYKHFYGDLDLTANEKLGLQYIRKAVDLRHPVAALFLARMYRRGDSPLSVSLTKYRMLLDRAIELGNSEAIYTLGDMYYKGVDGVNINYQRALRLFLEASHYGDGRALCAAAAMFYYGIGVPRNIMYTVNLYSKAAVEYRYAPAMRIIGTMYMQGTGMEKNEAFGRQWLDAADEREREEAEARAEEEARMQKKTPISLDKLRTSFRKGGGCGGGAGSDEQ